MSKPLEYYIHSGDAKFGGGGGSLNVTSEILGVFTRLIAKVEDQSFMIFYQVSFPFYPKFKRKVMFYVTCKNIVRNIYNFLVRSIYNFLV